MFLTAQTWCELTKSRAFITILSQRGSSSRVVERHDCGISGDTIIVAGNITKYYIRVSAGSKYSYHWSQSSLSRHFYQESVCAAPAGLMSLTHR